MIAVGNALTDDIITNTVFKFNSFKSKIIDTAIIDYRSLHGYSLSGKEVNYTILVNKKEVQKGKGKTDEEGKLRIGFTAIHSNSQPTEMITHIRLDNKTTVTKTIKFELPATQHAIQFFSVVVLCFQSHIV